MSSDRFRHERPHRIEDERRPAEAFLDYGPSLPDRLGVRIVRLLARDPECIYAYWEGGTSLRVVDVSTGSHRIIDGSDPGSWFGAAEPEHEYQAEIGWWEGGRFEVAARSNVVRTPRRNPASAVDDDWVLTPAEEAQLRAIAGQVELRREPGYGANSQLPIPNSQQTPKTK